ncbi:cutinase family protein [Nocardia terpenica]|uniref:cutinase family protein n=1 Tax=Nocardia terpenica TaxID=455432 RepID=UPI002FE41F1D
MPTSPQHITFDSPVAISTTGTPAPTTGFGRHRFAAIAAAWAAAITATAVTATTVTGLAGVAGADPGGGCAPFTAVLVPGTTETNPAANPAQPAGLLASLGSGLSARYGSDIDVRYLPYAASAAPYRASETGGVTTLSLLLGGLCASTRVVLAGYSQGADIVGDTTTAIGHHRGPLPPDRVLAVGLISDPRRDPATTQLGTPATGQGVAGTRDEDFGTLASRVRTVCATGDLYCATSPQTSPALSAIARAFTGNPNLTDPSPAGPEPSAAQAVPHSTSAGLSGPSGLSPSSVTRQVVVVLGGLAGFAANLPTFIDDLGRLPAALAAGDIAGAHRLAGELNTLASPLVRMASQVDLHLVAQALAMAAPLDQSGWIGMAAQITDILARLDIARLAHDIGAAQEVAWRAAAKLTAGDPLGGGLDLIGLAPLAADLAGTAAAALTGDGGAQLAGLAQSFTATIDPDTATALADLTREGGDAVGFYTSGVHQNGYHDAVGELLAWFTKQIDAVE